MKISELMEVLNNHVPFHQAESWDNVGLLIGNDKLNITGILTTLDCTDDVVNKQLNLIPIPSLLIIHLFSKE